jgi:hypothetical protein
MSAGNGRLLNLLVTRSVPQLVRVACVLAILGLLVMVYPLLFPGALGIILSMGVGHLLGIAAASLYVLAVVLDMARRRDR